MSRQAGASTDASMRGHRQTAGSGSVVGGHGTQAPCCHRRQRQAAIPEYIGSATAPGSTPCPHLRSRRRVDVALVEARAERGIGAGGHAAGPARVHGAGRLLRLHDWWSGTRQTFHVSSQRHYVGLRKRAVRSGLRDRTSSALAFEISAAETLPPGATASRASATVSVVSPNSLRRSWPARNSS